jgi:polyhydroxyalkanoate synthase subunit PhaC
MLQGNHAEITAPERDELAARAADGMLGPNPFVGLRAQDIAGALADVAQRALRRPRLVMAKQAELAHALIAILTGAADRAPATGDRRFHDDAWRTSPPHRMALQAYLAWAQALGGLVQELDFDARSTERARFAISLLIDAWAPTNLPWANPVAVRTLAESRGDSLVRGCRNLLRDLAVNGGMPAQVDKNAFALGTNLALSRGAVVFRNDVLELIQYAPAGETVFARPLMIIPPQINRFYLFDLAPGRSMIEYLVNHGIQVFAVSWRNPTAAERDWDMDRYVAALLAAIEAMRDITGSAKINLAGACSGAMTLAALLGHLAAKRDRRVSAALMMVVVLDHSEESQLGLFVTPETVAAAKQGSALTGVLSGQAMGRMFAWMRPNDLVWNYWVNNYLLGNAPPAFDILYWNNDTTRLPARFHAQLLDLFTENLFRRPGALTVLGTPIDLAAVTCDKYVVAGTTDHITPWQGGYRAALMFGGKTEFILSSSGHIQSIINPPGNAKAKYFVNPAHPADPQAWLSGAQAAPGSWWDHMRQWLADCSGGRIAAPASLGAEGHRPLADAPGTYVTAP